METSKVLLYIFVGFFIFSIISVGTVQVIFGVDISNLLNYVTPISTTVVLGYLGKASVENSLKIKSSNTIIDTNKSI